MTVDDFINQNNGQHIDEDGYYGAQCWDLVAKYARVVVGCPSFPTGSGGAEGLFRLFQDPIGQYFDRIPNDPNDPNQLPQKGDVIVWQASFSPPYGHTALVIGADSSGPTVLEQNGNNPGGVAYVKKRSWVGVSGWLRPKVKEAVFMPSKDEVISAFKQYNVTGLDGVAGAASQGQIDYYAARPWNTLLDDLLVAVADREKKTVASLQAQVTDLSSKVAQITAIQKQLSDLQTQFNELKKADELKDQRIADLQKQVPGSTTVEQPVVGKSIWDVIKDFLSQFKKG